MAKLALALLALAAVAVAGVSAQQADAAVGASVMSGAAAQAADPAGHKVFTFNDIGEFVIFPNENDGTEELGSPAVFTSDVAVDGETIGTAYWTGVYTAPTVVNYQLTLVFTSAATKHFGTGTLTAQGLGKGVESEDFVLLAVTGGTGAFLGASGTLTWEAGEYNVKFSK